MVAHGLFSAPQKYVENIRKLENAEEQKPTTIIKKHHQQHKQHVSMNAYDSQQLVQKRRRQMNCVHILASDMHYKRLLRTLLDINIDYQYAMSLGILYSRTIMI